MLLGSKIDTCLFPLLCAALVVCGCDTKPPAAGAVVILSFLKSALSCSVITTNMVFVGLLCLINSKYRKTNMVIVVVDKHISYYRHWTRKLEK